jgi:hypothetical protein
VAEVRCVDGSVLSVLPVPVLDRGGLPYEATLRLLHDGAAFGEVGERCAGRLAEATARVRDARRDGGPDAFPETGLSAALRGLEATGAGSAAVRRALPRDGELLSLRGRDPDDVSSAGELRVWLREDRTWRPGRDGARGAWSRRRHAVVDAWGDDGAGLRCLLDSAQLLALLARLVDECVEVRALEPSSPGEADATALGPRAEAEPGGYCA